MKSIRDSSGNIPLLEPDTYNKPRKCYSCGGTISSKEEHLRWNDKSYRGFAIQHSLCLICCMEVLPELIRKTTNFLWTLKTLKKQNTRIIKDNPQVGRRLLARQLHKL
jgi:hypothetical protein